MSDTIPCVIYAAKSTEDKHESIPDQLTDCREMAEDKAWQVEPEWEFTDEAFSAYSGNRGPGLEQAKAKAAELAAEYGRCVLVAQDADRFARGAGDAPGSADHVYDVFREVKRRRAEMWTVRLGRELNRRDAFDEGERSYGESERKSQAVKAGLKRRKKRGQAVGAVPVGYRVNKQVVEDEVITTRVIDSSTLPTAERIFDLVEAGSTFGDVARTFNAEGLRTRPTKTAPDGKPWTPRAIRTIILNTAYKGEKGYPAIIDADRFDAIHDSLNRMDEAAKAKRKGGRKPVDDSFFLKGVLFCKRCGAPMYSRSQYGRNYTCREVRQSSGLCDAPPVPAEFIEWHVLAHLDSFVDSVEGWLQQQVESRSDQRREREHALVRQRAKLTELERLQERASAMYRKALAEGESTAARAFKEAEKIEADVAAQEHVIAEAEAVVSEWSGGPDVDAALDFYNELDDLVHRRIEKAENAPAMNQALRQVLAGLWVEFDNDALTMEFELLGIPDDQYPKGSLRGWQSLAKPGHSHWSG
jgi:DNA invertase Pin-like site-specific DNA recombinase